MTDDGLTLFYMKRSAAGSAKRQFDLLMSERPFANETKFEIMRNFFIDSDVVEDWCNLLNKIDSHGITNEKQKQIDFEFKKDATIQYTKKMTYQLDPTSRLLVMGATDEKEESNWVMRFPDCLVSNFKLEGTYGAITGLPRSGKTSLATSFMELMYNTLGLNTITNIKIQNSPKYVTYVTRISDLIKAMIETENWVAILDETAVYIPRKRPLAKRNVDFELLARFIGKLHGRLILITHDFDKDIPPLLQTWISERYHKKGLTNVKVDLAKSGGVIKMHKLIQNVPDTTLEFIHRDISGIKFDVSIEELMQYIPEGGGDKQIDMIKKFLKNPKNYPKKEEKPPEQLTEEDLKKDEGEVTKEDMVIDIIMDDPKLQDICRSAGVGVYKSELIHGEFNVSYNEALRIANRLNKKQKKK